MLSAERVALNSDLQARRLDIRDKDLSQLTVFIDGLSTQAALLAGFAFSGLQALPPETNGFWKHVLFLSTSLTLGADIYVVCVGQLVTILAPTYVVFAKTYLKLKETANSYNFSSMRASTGWRSTDQGGAWSEQ